LVGLREVDQRINLKKEIGNGVVDKAMEEKEDKINANY